MYPSCFTFEIGLDDELDKEEGLDVFHFDPNFDDNELLWEKIKQEILGGDGEDGDDEEEEGGDAEEEEEEEGAEAPTGPVTVTDMTEQDLVNLRRTLYLTIMSSVSSEECTHKIAKLRIPEGCENELCNMLVECCSNERSYLRYYGLMGQRFCMMHRKYQNAFDEVFHTQVTNTLSNDGNTLSNDVSNLSSILLLLLSRNITLYYYLNNSLLVVITLYSLPLPWSCLSILHSTPRCIDWKPTNSAIKPNSSLICLDPMPCHGPVWNTSNSTNTTPPPRPVSSSRCLLKSSLRPWVWPNCENDFPILICRKFSVVGQPNLIHTLLTLFQHLLQHHLRVLT